MKSLSLCWGLRATPRAVEKQAPASFNPLFMEENPMLVLSRKTNERIVINNDIEICVVEIRGDKVRLGVNAPRDIVVDRSEVAEAKRRQLLLEGNSNGKEGSNGQETGKDDAGETSAAIRGQRLPEEATESGS